MCLDNCCQVRCNGTLCYYRQVISMLSIPSLLSKVSVSVVRDGSFSYVAGLHIISENGRRTSSG